jgi:hypothetical protein
MAESQEPIKTPTRPGSKWATGRRLKMTPPRERPGFAKGALVDRQTVAREELRRGKGKRPRARS